MKLRTPFSVINNALSDIRVMHDFNYEIPVAVSYTHLTLPTIYSV